MPSDIGLWEATFALIFGLDPGFVDIAALSLSVSLSAVLLAAVVALPAGALLALVRFPGRQLVITLANTLMGLPPVVIGLVLYLMLSHSGPLGWLRLLYSPGAMVLAQAVLVTPIILALTRQIIEALHEDYGEQLRSLGAGRRVMVLTLLYEGRVSLLTAVLAGFARASAEVGAVMIVGGNIAGYTRVMTTTIAMEVGKGELPMALALGIVLMTLAFVVNATLSLLALPR
ncbi:MAG: ABC transporter permease [Rhodospirillaceae bacterium]